ncbi:TetR/AcrR family transcriptional regulator [Nonomuraea sp. NN258]|uniref:TetR/AcrR family transcriptional regulator n=1 Tax=Nonomuraea antri TaxID=2730852 RepID=UPI001569B61E|nr:TetR/AcrR family transcriptional regulator [Nonomuraea antri]NRQ37171.1 TetR/AcrR family transcriptional regulator [Nonomuraea antri]
MPGDVSTPKELGDLRQALLDAAVRVLHDQGAARLTLRRVADAAQTSTMGIYTCFGGRTGLLAAIYQRAFLALRDRLTAALDGHSDPLARIRALASGYREFALEDPARYALMFERPLPDFDPSPQLRRDALALNFSLLTDATSAAIEARLIISDDPVRTAYLLWTTMHGIVSIELTHALRSPLPGWFLDSRAAGERVLADGVNALLTGLAHP